MANGGNPTIEEILNVVMDSLSELQATSLVEEINNTIARGVVSQEQPNVTQVFRPMNSEERLSIALEFILSAFEVPFMLSRSRELIECDHIIWSVDSKAPDTTTGATPPSDDRQNVTLSKLVSIIDELQLPTPEVA